jgi:histidinol-phosphate aminotransferase
MSAGLLRLDRNENLFIDPCRLVETARDVVASCGLSSYPDGDCTRLREALAEVYGVAPGNVYVGNGADGVLADLLGLRTIRRGFGMLHLLDVGFEFYPVWGRRFDFDLGTLAGATFETGRVFASSAPLLSVVDSPNSVSGERLSRADLFSLAADKRSFLIWDNVYGEFAGDLIPTPVSGNLAVVRSFSKFYGLAGLRVGYCIADEGLVEELLGEKDKFNVNAMGQAMALAALRRRAEYQGLAEVMIRARDELGQSLRGLGFRVREPGGNFLCVSHPHAIARDIASGLQERRILVRQFPRGRAAEWLRITVPPPEECGRLLAGLRSILRLNISGPPNG